MALAGKGMLLIGTDIPAEHEAEFNEWYDREHVEERVAIPGFVGARRFVKEWGDGPKYLAFYETERFEVLSSEPYRKALSAQTDWSKKVMANFQNVTRVLARVTATDGLGTGGVLGYLRLRPKDAAWPAVREAVAGGMARAGTEPGIISGFVLESDPDLSRPLPEQRAAGADEAGAADWYACLEGTTPEAVEAALDRHFPKQGIERAKDVARGAYRFMWGLTRAELERAGHV